MSVFVCRGKQVESILTLHSHTIQRLRHAQALDARTGSLVSRRVQTRGVTAARLLIFASALALLAADLHNILLHHLNSLRRLLLGLRSRR